MCWMISPSRKFYVYLVSVELVTHRCVFLPAEGACFLATCFKEQFKSCWGTPFLHSSGCSYFCISWDEREESCPVVYHEKGSSSFM